MPISVLLYHKISPDEAVAETDPLELTVSADNFASQMEYLERNYQVLSLGEALSNRGNLPDDRQHIVVTFDDGYRHTLRIAESILLKHNLPATFFVSPGHLNDGGLYWWDILCRRFWSLPQQERSTDEAAKLRSLCDRLMLLPYPEAQQRVTDLCGSIQLDDPAAEPDAIADWSQIQSLDQSLFSIGCHGYYHHCFSALSLTELRTDLRQAVQDFKTFGVSGYRTLAYPFGFPTCVTIDQIREAVGLYFESAFLSVKGTLSALTPGNQYLLNRCYVSNSNGEQLGAWLENLFRQTTRRG